VKLKPIDEVVCCCVDYGTFLSLAEKLGETMDTVFLYTPFEDEYRDINRCNIGTGLENVTRCDEFLEPEVLESIDLVIVPDTGYSGLQHHLRDLGKAVWGSNGVSNYELFRTKHLKMLRDLKLPVFPSVRIIGLEALCEHLKTVKDKWIKVNRYRQNMETWHHLDWAHSQPKVEVLAVEFGGDAESVVFVVQDPIETKIEIGYDGWNVDGRFPAKSFQGFEKKDQLYLGAWLEAGQLPKEIQTVNRALAPLLKANEYRNFIATEIRVKDKTPYFIDPTMRMAGQTQEHLLESCTNLPEVIWRGANGELVEPDFAYKVAAEATMHYTAGDPCERKVLRIPLEARRWFKLYHYYLRGDMFHFPPGRNDEIGVVLGFGDTKEEAVAALKRNFALIKGEPVEIRDEDFDDLFKEISRAEANGMRFT
jgi:hypothetical protein